MEKILDYRSIEEDFFDDGTPHKVPKGYRWVRRGLLARLGSGLVYTAALLFGSVYCRFFLHMQIKGAGKVRKCKTGFFLYGNHTQPVGDVVIPALVCFPKRIYTVVSPANLDLPGIGKLLPYLGALPIGDSVDEVKALSKAIGYRIGQGNPIVIYPEAHVWPYYTGIRPFPDTSFKFPEKHGVPAFSMTATYQKRRFGKKPKMTVYVDGPFFPEGDTPKGRARNLKQTVWGWMQKRSRLSNCEYIAYRKARENEA